MAIHKLFYLLLFWRNLKVHASFHYIFFFYIYIVEDGESLSMEDKLRSLGLLDERDLTAQSRISSDMLKGIDLEANLPLRKVCLLCRSKLLSSFSNHL